MKIFEQIVSKVRGNKKWFMTTMTTLVVLLVVVVASIFMLPKVKANAIEDDVTNKIKTYNLSVIAEQNAGNQGVTEVVVDITDPDYSYYIKGSPSEIRNMSIVFNYDLAVSKEVPIYLDDVSIRMSENAPIIKFGPSTNENTNIDGSYKVIVKGQCYLNSNCAGATYPVIQVESVEADLYQLKPYNGDDYLNPENYYDLVKKSFGTKVEFTSYEFADNEVKTECGLTIVTASGSYGAGIGTTAGTVDISGDNLVLSDGSGTPIADFSDGTLMKLFNKPLKPGAQALVGAGGYTGDITFSGALHLIVVGNGYGACVGGGASYVYEKPAKPAGNVTINGGTINIEPNDVIINKQTYSIPAFGGGINTADCSYGQAKNVVINGGSVYLKNTTIPFGVENAHPVNSKGDMLYLYTTDYIKNIDDDGKLLIESQRYEQKYKADITKTNNYMEIYFEYNSNDYTTVLPFSYEGFGHNSSGLGDELYFYLPATPLCSLTISEGSFLQPDIPIVEVLVDGLPVDMIDGAYWMPAGSNPVVTFKNIPVYMDVEKLILTDVKTTVPTDYTSAFVYDEETGYYTVTLTVATDSQISIDYASDIYIDYNYGFVEGDSHEVINNSPVKYELGKETTLDSSFVIADDLIFEGWYSEITGEKITHINDYNLPTIMDATGHIKLVAKWSIVVSYDMGEGTGEEIEDVILPYGEPAQIVISQVVPELPYHIFEGWVVDGQLFGNGYVYDVTPIGNINIVASYLQDSFFVYIDASPKKFNFENVEIYVGINGTEVNEANNLLLKNPDGSYITKEIDGVMYYCAVASNEDNLAIILTQKPGHIISGQSVTVTEGKGNQIVIGTSGSEDGKITIQLTIDEDDVYISTESEFVLRKYDIKFFDGTNVAGGNRLWAESEFTYTIEELDKTIGEILGDKVNEIVNINNRFFVFDGWKDTLNDKVYSNEDAFLENLGNVILVAQWKKIEKYPINVTVMDNRFDAVSKDVFAVPFYLNEDGSIEAIYTEKVLNLETNVMENISYAKENDKIIIKFFYYDNAGNVKDVTEGVILEGMELKYTKSTGSSTTEEIAEGVDYFVFPKPKAGTAVNVTATIDIQEYTIVYWDTRNATNNNPATYTFFDEIELEKLHKDVNWLLVTADTDKDNFDDVKTVPISKIERGSMGNLVLKADWSDYKEEMYTVQIDTLVENGVIEIIYPVDRDEYLPNETLVIKVIPNKGYKLKGNVISYREVQPIILEPKLMTGFNLSKNITMYGAVEITGSDGVYLVDMPERNILITAIFEIATYNITYNETDGLENDNVSTFTYFDVVDLLPVEKEGYEFKGWIDENGNVINRIVNRDSDVVLTPVFEEKIVEPDDEEETTGDDSTAGDDSNTGDDSNAGDDSNTGDDSNAGDGSNVGGNGNENPSKPNDEKPSDEDESKVTITPGQNNGAAPETETKKPHLVGGGNAYGGDIYTGDTTDIARLVLICVAATLVLVIAVLSKGAKFEEDETVESNG